MDARWPWNRWLRAAALLWVLAVAPAGAAAGGGPGLPIGAFPGHTAWVPAPAPRAAPLPAGWGMVIPGTRAGRVFAWRPAGESGPDWSRIVTYEFIRVPGTAPTAGAMGTSPEAVRDRMLSQCAAAGPEGTDPAAGPGPEPTPEAIDLLFTWHVAGCKGQPEQTQITRLTRVSGGIHRLSYTVKGPMPAPMEEAWEGWIAGMPAIEGR